MARRRPGAPAAGRAHPPPARYLLSATSPDVIVVGADPRQDPLSAPATLASPIMPLRDKLAVAAFSAWCGYAPVGRIARKLDTTSLEPVATYRIDRAQPACPPPLRLRQPVRVGPGRYVCGDWRDTPSIQGALVSGRRAAAAVIGEW